MEDKNAPVDPARFSGKTEAMKYSFAAIFSAAVFVSRIVPTPVHANDWPNWLGPDHNGKSREVLPEKPELTAPLWSAELGIGFSSITVADGRVYSMGHSDGKESVFCFSEKDGGKLWSDSYDAPLLPRFYEGGPGATPTVDDGRVFTISKDGQLRVYSVEKGKLLWSKDMQKQATMHKPPEWGFAGSPLVYGKNILIEAGATFAFDKETGRQIWKSEKFRPAYGTPQLFEVGGRKFLVTLKTDGLVILDPENGKTLDQYKWRTSFQTNATTPLLIEQGKLFLSTGYDRGCALFRFDGNKLNKLYETKSMSNHMGNSVFLNGFLYGFNGTAHRGPTVEFTCINAATGEKQWSMPDYKFGSVIAAGKDLIVLSESGELLIGKASPEGFEPQAKKIILSGRCWTPPVLANGRIYARNAAGKMVVLIVR